MENESSGCRPRAVNQSLQLSDVSSLLIFPKTPVSGEGLKRHELLQAGWSVIRFYLAAPKTSRKVAWWLLISVAREQAVAVSFLFKIRIYLIFSPQHKSLPVKPR